MQYYGCSRNNKATSVIFMDSLHTVIKRHLRFIGNSVIRSTNFIKSVHAKFVSIYHYNEWF